MRASITATIITLLLALGIIHSAHAGGDHHDNGRHGQHHAEPPAPVPEVTNITEVTEVHNHVTEQHTHVTNLTEEYFTNQYYVDDDLYNAGIATSYASSQHQFDFGSSILQGSVAAASYGGEVAGDFAIGKVYRGVLFNGSIGKAASGHTAVGGAINWRFQ